MNHPVAQVVALTCYANAVVKGFPVPRFFPDNSTCKFCDQVKFIKNYFGLIRGAEIAGTPDQWFVELRAQGTASIRVSRESIRTNGTWVMEQALASGKSFYWSSKWEVWNQDAPERRIWRVTYDRIASGKCHAKQPTKLESARDNLVSALESVRIFSEGQRCAGFTDCFTRALETLNAHDGIRHGYHKDLAPDGTLSAAAVQVLDASQSAWVFGGMGSWNDMLFEGEAEKQYNKVSNALFDALVDGIVAATNESCSPVAT